MELPSTLMRKSASPAPKTMWVPSGDQAGLLLGARCVVRRLTALPSAFMTYTSYRQHRLSTHRVLTKAICVPSGDQLGS
jgi:hypothetical protein